MARKNPKKLPRKRGAITTSPKSSWLEIPKKLRDLIYKKHVLFSYASCGSRATKTWKLSPKSCHTNGKSTSSIPQLRDTTDCETQGFIGGYPIPIWDSSVPQKHTALSFSNHDNFIFLVVTGISHPAFVYYKRTNPLYTPVGYNLLRHNPEEHKWVKQDSTIIDPYCSNQRYMQFGNAVGLNGKFYALSLQGTLVVIEEVDSHMVITGVSMSRAVPSVLSRHFREFLIESNGEILLIFLISTKLANIVDNVEIFSLQILPKLAWKKVESIGNRVVFVGGNISWIVDASELGCKGNCINLRAVGWWVYDMARGEISPGSWSSDSSGTMFILGAK